MSDNPASATIDSRGRRIAAVAAGTGLAVTLVALAFMYVTAVGSGRIADNAQALHWANATAGSTAVSRAATAQAVVFGVDNELGVASDASRDAAVAEARATVADVERWIEIGSMGSGLTAEVAEPVEPQLAAFVDAVERAVAAVAVGDAQLAVDRYEAEVEPTYAVAASELAIAQERIVAEIESTERVAGMLGLAAQMAATLLIPAAAIVVYYTIVRRQYREAETQLQAKLAAERELNRAKDEFVAGVSHELRTPLTGIYGFSEYLIDRGIIDPDEALELIGHINQEAAELSRMVDDLLSAARLDSDSMQFDLQVVDVEAEVDSVMEPLRRADYTVEVDVDEAVYAYADPLRARQIIRNLISNALKHGGDRIRVTATTSDSDVEVMVADDGAGVSDAVAEKLFERFVNEGDQSLLEGSVGLGLSIARSLARQMGGDITYARDAGWTRFVLRLPAALDVRTEADADRVGGEPVVPVDSEQAAVGLATATSREGHDVDYTIGFDR